MVAPTNCYIGIQEADPLATAGVRSNARSFSPTHSIQLSSSYPTGNAGTAHAPTCTVVSKTHQAKCCYLGNGYHKSLERNGGGEVQDNAGLGEGENEATRRDQSETQDTGSFWCWEIGC